MTVKLPLPPRPKYIVPQTSVTFIYLGKMWYQSSLRKCTIYACIFHVLVFIVFLSVQKDRLTPEPRALRTVSTCDVRASPQDADGRVCPLQN